MLNLTHLKVLEAVARRGSVTEAAKELHYSQPSVSHHLGRLEAATEAKLIQRVGRGIRLTPEGELLAAGGAATPRRVGTLSISSVTTPISVPRPAVTPPGSAAASAAEPPRSRHASAPASHHTSPTPATTLSSPSRWWAPAWV